MFNQHLEEFYCAWIFFQIKENKILLNIYINVWCWKPTQKIRKKVEEHNVYSELRLDPQMEGMCRFSILWATWYFCWGKIGVFIPGVFIPGLFIPRVLQRYLFRGYLFQGYLFRRYLFLGCFFLGCLFLGCFFQGCFFLGYLFRGIYSWGIYSGHRLDHTD